MSNFEEFDDDDGRQYYTPEPEGHMLNCDAGHEHKPETCCSCGMPHDGTEGTR